MNDSLEENIKKIKAFFENKDVESKYLMLIELGKQLAPLPEQYKTEENKVKGCQSMTYLFSSLKDGKMHFQAESNALISAGLVALLILAYEAQSPSTILEHPPAFLDDLGIHASLSPSRANGLFEIYKKMQQDALSFMNKSSE